MSFSSPNSSFFESLSNPVNSAAHFNALSDNHQSDIANLHNDLQLQILGEDRFSPSKLRQDITVSKLRLAYARMAADDAWKEVGAEIASRKNSDFMNLSKA